MRTNLRWCALAILSGLLVGACGSSSDAGDDDDGHAPGNDGGSASNDGGSHTQNDGSTSSDGSVATTPPAHGASTASFIDIDPKVGTVGGTLFIGKASDESDVTAYVVYLADAAGTKTSATPLATLAATGKNLTMHVAEGTVIPTGALQFLVVTKNAAGEMTTGAKCDYKDATLHAVSLASFSGGTLGPPVRITFDAANRKLVLLSSYGAYFYCNLDGTSCIAKDITGGHEFYYPPKPVIDPTTEKVLILAQTYSTRQNTFLISSALDGTAATAEDLTDPTVQQSGTTPVGAFDTARNHLLMVADVGDTTYGNVAHTSVLYDCALAPISCERRNIAVSTLPQAQAVNGGRYPSAVVDTIGHNVIVATEDDSNSDRPFVLVCPTDGSAACTGHNDIFTSGGFREQSGPYAMIDEVAHKLVIATADTSNAPQFVRCNLDGTLCGSPISMTQATGLPAKQVGYARAVAEPVENAIVAVGLKGTNGIPEFFRCGMDGSHCAFVELAASGTSEGDDVTTDPLTGQAFVLSETGGAFWLYYLQ